MSEGGNLFVKFLSQPNINAKLKAWKSAIYEKTQEKYKPLRYFNFEWSINYDGVVLRITYNHKSQWW